MWDEPWETRGVLVPRLSPPTPSKAMTGGLNLLQGESSVLFGLKAPAVPVGHWVKQQPLSVWSFVFTLVAQGCSPHLSPEAVTPSQLQGASFWTQLASAASSGTWLFRAESCRPSQFSGYPRSCTWLYLSTKGWGSWVWSRGRSMGQLSTGSSVVVGAGYRAQRVAPPPPQPSEWTPVRM